MDFLPEREIISPAPEVTPEMIEAGVEAYCQSPFEPTVDEMRTVVRKIFFAMRSAQKPQS